MKSHPCPNYKKLFFAVIAIGALSFIFPSPAESSCSSPANAIEAENCLIGTPQSTWDIPSRDAGDPTIQGFATDISVNSGSTVNFKVNTPASAWRLDIYRMGYYGGNGARLVATVNPSVPLPQSQPACITDSSTGLTDCGNWAVSASWAVPSTATSGIYFAKASRSDTGGSSHIVFIVRNDASHSDILFQTSDTSWQAYNDYSQNFYGCNSTFNSACRAYKVSYNRPFHTRSFSPQTWVFNAEYPMVRWLEANGYDVTYFTGMDTDRNGSLLLNHKMFMSNGHDEYWSGNERTNVETARAAGVHLAFFSGNKVYWKTRWENSIAGGSTPNRTLVCYKETWANAVIDPFDPPTWTGTFRDPRFSPPADGARPENALAGTMCRIAGGFNGAMTVPQDDGRMRFWSNTSIAALAVGQTYTLVPGSLGEELDTDEDNGFRPAGVFHLSTTAVTSNNCLLDYGLLVSTCNATHNLTLYRHASGSLVFSAGTYDWAWGLDANHDRSSLGSTTDVNMQQATVNLLADMGVQPTTLRPGLVTAAISTDHNPPTSTVTSPSSGSSFPFGSAITISGTASDAGGGVVGGVEVSVDGGTTWHPAVGRESWNYTWNATTSGQVSILSRAVDDSGNIENPSTGVSVTVSGSTAYTIWPGTTLPWYVDAGPDNPVELGVKFRSDVAGNITGIRFYKASTNTGTHVGNLWSSTGALLATATFANETASGWQQVNFTNPVAITANTVYVVSYHTTAGHYSDNANFFDGNGMDAPPLHAVGGGGNGVFAYGTTSTFPGQSSNNSNYWVDVVLSSGATLSSIIMTPANQTISTGTAQPFTATGTFSDNSTQNITSSVTWASSNTGVATITAAGLATGVAAGSTTISATLSGITGSTTLTVQASPPTITTKSILWRNRSTGQNAIWYMNGATFVSVVLLNTLTDLNWEIVGVADFDADSHPDLLWRNRSTGQNAIWYMNGATFVSGVLLNTLTDLNWEIVDVADFDADSHPDLLWRNRSTGQNAIWYMNGATFVSGVLLNTLTDLNWEIVGVADFDADSHPDLLWRNRSTGQNAIWYMNGATFVSGVLLNTLTDLNWEIVGVADFDADSHPDLLWRNRSTGQNAIWYMNGATFVSGVLLNTLTDLNWEIVGVAK